MNDIAVNLNSAWMHACTIIICETIEDNAQRVKALDLLEIAYDKATKAYEHASANQHTSHTQNCVGV